MTEITTTDRGPVEATLAVWLVPDDRRLVQRVGTAATTAAGHEPRAHRWGARLGRAARLTVAAEIVHELREVLGDELVDVLVGAMATHSALQEAARRTVADPEASGRVRLGHYVVRTHHTVHVLVVAAGAFRFTLPFELEVDFDVAGANGEVRAGRLVALALTPPSVRGTVRLHGQEIYRQTGTLQVTRTVPLGDGVRILSDEGAGRTPSLT